MHKQGDETPNRQNKTGGRYRIKLPWKPPHFLQQLARRWCVSTVRKPIAGATCLLGLFMSRIRFLLLIVAERIGAYEKIIQDHRIISFPTFKAL